MKEKPKTWWALESDDEGEFWMAGNHAPKTFESEPEVFQFIQMYGITGWRPVRVELRKVEL